MRVAVTGSTGLVGWHLCCALSALDHEVVLIDRSTLMSPVEMATTLDTVDAVVHAAGVNRSADDEVYRLNVELAESLTAALESATSLPRVLFTNSTHIDRDSMYGESKRRVAEMLSAAAGDRFTDVVLPGVFGEMGRPFSNSVVSTFAHQLAAGDELTINDDAEIELLHAQDAADVMIDTLASDVSGAVRPAGFVTSVVALAERLTDLSARYDEGVIPDIGLSFDRALFNTLRSYRYPARYPVALESRSDDRGSLTEVVRADTSGQCFVSSTKPGVARGNHYHRRKVERFAVMEGSARISLRRLYDSDIIGFDVSGQQPVVIDIPTLHTHSIINTGDDDLITFFWADELFDPDAPDTFFEEV